MELRVEDLVLRYVGDELPSLVVERVATRCPLGVLGWGGSGKTSFLRALCGVERIERGNIFLDGREVGELLPREREIALISRDTPLFLRKTARFNLEFPLKRRKMELNVDALPREIVEILDQKTALLDEKMRMELLLLRVFLRNPSLILIDEPTAFCPDPTYFLERAAQLIDPSRLILATFDHELASIICNNFLVFDRGKIVAQGTLEQLRSSTSPLLQSLLR